MTANKRLLTRQEAAAYCGLKPSAFSDWVRQGTMPKPVPGTRRWDKSAIDAKLDTMAGIAKNDNAETPLQKWRREHDARRAKS
ncbi:helix-turn-helix transcriptional regulator [Phyllobacterium bourgognense]|uniref:AlpA family transcriptional regulator n=1 Tax=Phyllobacterium bourgognense TaxID=314236 RepID=A0A368YMW1_9HYPH|nr:hypothetical protein [Phyllobacterium bourgognense]RCW80939.1 AlpA family transcriptional regulator [Phyllobacterium bourgognense]